MIKRLLIALVLVAVVCGGLVGFNLFRSKMISDFFANMPVPVVTVSATTAEPTTWTPAIEAIGTLNASQGVDVASQASGVVKSVNFKANDDVEQGELLVQIDDAVERADLLAARAQIARDRAALDRARTLSNRGVSSEASLEQAETTLAASESQLARLQATIDLKAIEAPFSGTIGIPRIEDGQYVQPGTVIATLQQLDTMRVDFTVPEQRLSDLKIGQPATFGLTPDSFPYSGRIVGIDPKIDPQTRLISVRAEVDNPDGDLRPGQFVRIRVELPAVADVIALPQTSVITSLYGDYVYLVEPAGSQPESGQGQGGEGQGGEGEAPAAEATSDQGAQQQGGQQQGERLVARQTFVEIGRRQGGQIEIVKGVSAGQRVVTSGQNKLANNTPVKIDNSIDPAAVALGREETDS